MTQPADDNPFPSTEMVQRATGLPVHARLSTNENEFGPAASVIEAIAEAACSANRYPDCDHFELRHVLAAELGVEPGQVHVAAGIDGLLNAVCRARLGPGRTAVTTLGTYPTFDYFARAAGTTVEYVPCRDLRCDVTRLAERARRAAAVVVYLAEPDNPTGSTVGWPAIVELRQGLSEDCLLVIDGAYAEYQEPADRPAASDVVERGVLWLRTFSKAYGLAGMRVGYAIGTSSIVRSLRRGNEHYAVGRLSSHAALAAVADRQHLDRVVRQTAAGRADYRTRLTAMGFEVRATQTNFVTFRPAADGWPSGSAEYLRRGLAEAGVLVRRLTTPGLDDLLRMTVGPPEQRATIISVINGLLTRTGLDRAST